MDLDARIVCSTVLYGSIQSCSVSAASDWLVAAALECPHYNRSTKDLYQGISNSLGMVGDFGKRF
uniref:Uncharacterized protein n=1 Tax=Oryza sativa subsp. indica TaxID=39946 RepID=A0A1V1H190_ORYSI|nr:hypothetical protein [Oryza sativa Indica Group]